MRFPLEEMEQSGITSEGESDRREWSLYGKSMSRRTDPKGEKQGKIGKIEKYRYRGQVSHAVMQYPLA